MDAKKRPLLRPSLHSLLENKKTRWWVICGVYYGYPACCISDFCETYLKHLMRSKEQLSVHQNFGFVPCTKCSKKILAGKETLESLLKNRICKKQFPDDDE